MALENKQKGLGKLDLETELFDFGPSQSFFISFNNNNNNKHNNYYYQCVYVLCMDMPWHVCGGQVTALCKLVHSFCLRGFQGLNSESEAFVAGTFTH